MSLSYLSAVGAQHANVPKKDVLTYQTVADIFKKYGTGSGKGAIYYTTGSSLDLMIRQASPFLDISKVIV